MKKVIAWLKSLLSPKKKEMVNLHDFLSKYDPTPVVKKENVVVGEMIRVCKGGKHAWYNSNVGVIRKPIIS